MVPVVRGDGHRRAVDAELARRADCRLMIARGTHVRLGMSSPFRQLIG